MFVTIQFQNVYIAPQRLNKIHFMKIGEEREQRDFYSIVYPVRLYFIHCENENKIQTHPQMLNVKKSSLSKDKWCDVMPC